MYRHYDTNSYSVSGTFGFLGFKEMLSFPGQFTKDRINGVVLKGHFFATVLKKTT